MTCAIGTAARVRASASSIAWATSAAVAAPGTSIFSATSSSSGPRCIVRRWITEDTPGPTNATRIRSTTSRAADSPSSRDRVSTESTTAMITSRMPIPAVPPASHRPSPVASVMLTPPRASTSPTSAPKSSRSTTGSSGAFAPRMNATQDWDPRNRFDSATAVRNENPSMPAAASRTTTGTHCHESMPCGSAHLCQAS
ncbi:hypothetical protein GALL_489890 [mine drainage metagenome]|uniref:Uncharacterized protein n=1 Tax=mine drainage metagenome TaxID=410659 RepID=A0A1J5PCP8_9ZZZZ